VVAERPDSRSRAALVARFPFALDQFQLDAIDALDDGRSVLVAAPTGSGKTVVAEYAIAVALAHGRRAFYTTPIKALSNQKYRDLAAVHGGVGLLTGDNAIDGDAPVVVMTTEVLRNMIYAESTALADLDVVVLDEVHFLQDAYRGPVWEEVIIHLPAHVRLVCLSATVSNAAEVADWITTVRGPTEVVVEEKRPVQLENLYMVGDRSTDRLHLLPTEVDGRPNPVALRMEAESTPAPRHRRGPRVRRRLYTPSRLDVVERLQREGMLPAIYFIFSRNACDEAAAQCLTSGLVLTDQGERRRIREILDERLAFMRDDDLEVLGYGAFAAQLEAGFGSHHAGLVPPFKEAVEACFVEGLVKVVFATETLAVGINMPARAVVIEKLTKFTGDHHEMLTPGEYTQLTGRAGRRGIDDAGDAIVLWSPFVPFHQVASLVSSRSFRLTSAFRPTYNMAANLVRSYTNQEAHHLLNLSFAQYQADREVVTLSARLERRQAHLAELRSAAESPYGDIHEYRAMVAGVTAGHSDAAVEAALTRLRPGDVIHVDKGRSVGRAAVLTNAFRKGGMKVGVITSGRAALNLSATDFAEPPSVLGTIELPTPFAPNAPEFQRAVADRLDAADLRPHTRSARRQAAAEAHAVEDDPDLQHRLALANQAERVAAEVDNLRTRVRRHTQSVSQGFDRVLGVLAEWGYVDGWSLTEAGETLSRLFHESDLLVAESLRRGYLDDLPPSQLAALVSVFVYEHRSSDAPPAPWFPSADVRERWLRIAALSRSIGDAETQAHLPVHRPPDPTFVAIAFAWAAGEGFAEVVEAEDLSGGDFVRTTKSLIDLLRQLAIVAPTGSTRRAASQAADRLLRGVVAASSSVEPVAVTVASDPPVTLTSDEPPAAP
jgi:ATP-dependent RNA helicase HelY